MPSITKWGTTTERAERYAFVLTACEQYWTKLCQRNAGSEGPIAFVRKGQVGPVGAKKLIFYIKKPMAQIRGFADFVERFKGGSVEMWNRYGDESCFKSKEEYDSFVAGRDKVTVVRMDNLVELDQPKAREEINAIMGSMRGFRGRYVDSDTARRLIT
jgi:predicted transcriptional regulator